MKPRGARWSGEQRDALKELRALHADHPEAVLAVGSPYRSERRPSDMLVKVTLSMALIDVLESDTLLETEETVIVGVGDTYPESPPRVYVDHDRFVDVVHVLYGRQLCIYLDEDREWHPAGGITDALNQVWKLLEDAANDRFDSLTALFHPVGGLNPATRGTGAAVVREFPGVPGKPLSVGSVRYRTEHRIDVGPKDAFFGNRTGRALTITVPGRLPYGPGRTVEETLGMVAAADGPSMEVILAALQRAAANSPATPLCLTLAVARGAHNEAGWHLCTARLRLPPARRASLVAATTPAGMASAIGPDIKLEWYNMSDQRPDLVVRRDARRPTIAFKGLDVAIWGCGALGSWIAELLVRAGVARIRLIDNSGVGAGLLVRQNYLEDDVGYPKAHQLKARLEAISDSVTVEAIVASAAGDTSANFDLMVDATVNEAVAAYLTPRTDAVVASIATDVESASLGLLVVGSPSNTPTEVQTAVSGQILQRGDLEPFHRFWNDADPTDLMLPAPGCSTPTFHGSAADAMGLASTMVSLLGNHLAAPMPGIHLINMPHSGVDAPGHTFFEMAA